MPDVVVVRRTLQSVQRAQAELAAFPLLKWAGGTQDLREAVDLIQTRRPQLLLCDLRLVSGTALHLLLKLRERAVPMPQVLLLTPSADDLLLYESMASGAHAYALEDGRPAWLSRAVRELLAGRAAMSPMIARQMLLSFGVERSPLQEAVRPPPHWTAQNSAHLSEADRRLLSLLSHGLLDVEIARCWNQTLEQVARRTGLLYRKLHGQHDLTPGKGPDTTPDTAPAPETV